MNSDLGEWSTVHLFAAAIAAHELTGNGNDEYDPTLDALVARDPADLLSTSLGMLSDTRAVVRSVAADLISRMGRATIRDMTATCNQLLATVAVESNEIVLSSMISALGSLEDHRAAATVAGYRHHPSSRVRLSIARALPWLMDRSDPAHLIDEGDAAVAGLISLCDDVDSEVRDWATNGLGTAIDVDGPMTRATLWRRLADEDTEADTRSEALVALARRHDPLVVLPVREALESEVVGTLAVEAAWSLSHPSLYDALTEMTSWWDVDEALLTSAIQECDPVRQADEVDAIVEFLAAAVEVEPEIVLVVETELRTFEPLGPFVVYLQPPGKQGHSLRQLLTDAGSPRDAVLVIRDSN